MTKLHEVIAVEGDLAAVASPALRRAKSMIEKTITCATLVFAFALSPSPSLAHGEANWIMENPATVHCCGPEDCGWIDSSAVHFDGTNYIIPPGTIQHNDGKDRVLPGYTIPYAKAKSSNNHHYWICLNLYGDAKQRALMKLRCFFSPPSGV